MRKLTSTLGNEDLRRKFQPPKTRILFVGESPPASGRFFYQANSGLYRAMRDAFHAADPSITDANFLEAFQSAGCYLIDLCPHPVDHLHRKARRDACLANEASLSQQIACLQPAVIATLLRSIETIVTRAAAAAHWSGPFLHLPYPGRWSRHRADFLRTLVPALYLSGDHRIPPANDG